MLSGAIALDEWPPEGLERVDKCPVCGSRSRTPLYRNLTDRSYRSAPGTWQLYRCTECRSAYLDPRPTPETIGLAFATYYSGASPPGQEAALSPLHRFRRKVRNGYLNSHYGYDLRPASRLGAWVVPWLPRRRQIADEFVRHLHMRAGRPRLLDVGCGEGEFLVRMESLGWEAHGIEPHEDAARLARSRGADVQSGTLATAQLPPTWYDAVTFRLVLEQVPDPARALASVHEALAPGGILWIATPSLEAESHRRFRSNWILLEPPRSGVIFTASSLASLVRKLGFEVIAIAPARQTQWAFRLSAAISEGLPPFQKPARLSPRLSIQARIADVRALVRPTLADFFILIARKP